MEKKNPLEEFRKEIQKSHSDGYIDDFTKLGISDEILDICDALDRFYGIYKTPQTSGDKIVDILNSTLSYTNYTRTILNSRDPFPFSSSKNLVHETKKPLSQIKLKLSKENSLYLNMSSAIVAIIVNSIVTKVNNYHSIKPYTLGMEISYLRLINAAVKTMTLMKDFDMTVECRNNYDENRNLLIKIYEEMGIDFI